MLIAAILLLVFGRSLDWGSRYNVVADSFGWMVDGIGVILFGALLMLAIDNSNRYLGLVFNSGILQRIGRMSYGIYLYHLPVLYLLSQHTHLRHGVTVLALFSTLAMATLSWQYVEKPFMRFAKKEARG